MVLPGLLRIDLQRLALNGHLEYRITGDDDVLSMDVRFGDRLAVKQRSVAAAEIHELPETILLSKLKVLARYPGIQHHHVGRS